MPGTATLLQMRTQAVAEADAIGELVTTFGQADQVYVDAFINSALFRLHGILSLAFEDYQLTRSSVTLTGGVFASSEAALPADMFKLRRVDQEIQALTKFRTLESFNLVEENQVIGRRKYALKGNSTLMVRPIASAAGTYWVYYTPMFTPLAVDTDTYPTINGWEEIAVLDAAIRIKDAREKDSGVLANRRAELLQAVADEKKRRDAGGPRKVRHKRLTLYEQLMGQDLDPDKYT